MLSVDEAQQCIRSAAMALEPELVPLENAMGLLLAEDVVSDIDMPPFDKALVDGFAVRSQDLVVGARELEVIAEIYAGQAPWPASEGITSGQSVRIMTGAPMPPGADAVVMQERTDHTTSGAGRPQRVSVNDPRFKPGQNIMLRATEMSMGQTVLRAGAQLRPGEIGVLAAVGRDSVQVTTRPRVAIASTGNELVEASARPGPGQIRNSNGPLLAALVTRAGGAPHYLGIARDTHDELLGIVRTGLEDDVLLLSGGVSAGELDLVPGVLRQLGVREVFHKVNLKPGKPLWFGVLEHVSSDAANRAKPNQPGSRRTLVFGLPGNPVSVVVCFEVFVRPAIRRLLGFADPGPRIVSAVLREDRSSKSDRPTYWPARLEQIGAESHVRLVAWKGSPDLRAMTDANCFAIIPSGDQQLRQGDRIQVLSTEY
jgi:molybdopterin molybdotransferase